MRRRVSNTAAAGGFGGGRWPQQCRSPTQSLWALAGLACLLTPTLIGTPRASARPPAGAAGPQQQAGVVRGLVRDAISRGAVPGARVAVVRDAAVIRRTATAEDGSFRLTGLAPATYDLLIDRIGYDSVRIAGIAVSLEQTSVVDVLLPPRAIVVNPEIVTASRSAEKSLDAPASVSVVGGQEVRRRSALTPADYTPGLPGVDVIASGIVQRNVVTRGFNNAGSGQLLVLTDNRYAAVPSLRINAYNFIPLVNDDVDRIEIVRGPAAALYGPNATAGVMHVITRSPLTSQGSTLDLLVGQRGLVEIAGRHAGIFSPRLGWKLSGQYMRATDWGYVDPEEARARANALGAGADADTLHIGRRDSLIERVAGDARIDLRLNDGTTLIASAGINDALNNLDITGFGAAQVHGWRYTYVQARLVRPGVFAEAFYNGSDAGSTYLLRTGQPVIDRSRMLAAQFQHVLELGDRERLTWGVDAQRTDPRTAGTIFGRYEANDRTDEIGGYVHSETHLAPFDVIAAVRADHHNRVAGTVLSPRGGLVLHAGPAHNLRLTYNRAFNTPTSYDLFLDLLVTDSLRDPATNTAFPFAVRTMGVPEHGFTFRRDCGGAVGGLCMRSPYAPSAAGGPDAYLPADATVLWGVLVDTLRGRGVDLSALPPPTPAQVGTVFRKLSIASEAFEPTAAADVVDLPALRHRITNTLELGYKGLFGDRLLASIDLYYSWYHGFTGTDVLTPNVFFDGPTLDGYLAQYLPQAQADALANLIAQIPVGTISPVEAFDPTAILVASRQFGRVSLWGADVALAFQPAEALTVTASYSWASQDSFPNVGGVADLALNAPRHKASVAVAYRHPALGLTFDAAGRLVESFPVISDFYVGRVPRYTVFDAGVTYRVPLASPLTAGLTAWNVLDHRHREFVGVPRIGRLMVARLRLEW